ncbi:MAG: glycosyltransferase [Microscillaceae bacterium]|nr:glycosyltransferase [Microscillaceae bacterium]
MKPDFRAAPPLVSVICLCYQQAAFVRQALESVVCQSYPHWELLIVEDASSDESGAVIQKFISEIPAYREAFRPPRPLPRILFWQNTENQGNCRSFNQALAQARGKYVIDLAADDVLLDHRLASQVAFFDSLPAEYGVIFANALLINAEGRVLGHHYRVNAEGRALHSPPEGDVYAALLRRYFISTPTMMMRKSVLEALGGYDESLSYEDFDFWIRSARHYRYAYQDEVNTQKRILPHSHSQQFYQKKHNPHLHSTLRVCHKAKQLNQSPQEDEALALCVAIIFARVSMCRILPW